MRGRFLLSILFFLSIADVFSQFRFSIPQSERIGVRDSSCLFFPSGKDLFFTLFEKIDTLLYEGEGNINILHMGGSHVQAGIFSHQIRYDLLSMENGITANRGLLFPFSVAKTNNPYNYKVSYTGSWSSCKNTNRDVPYVIGLSGMVVTTSSVDASISLCMRNNDGLHFDFDKIRLLGHSDSGFVMPVIRADSLIYFGEFDSLSKSYTFTIDGYVDNFTLGFITKDSVREPFYLRGFILENDLPGITYNAVGVNGASLSSYLQCPLFENDLQFIKPDLCIFGIGINDASGDNFDTTFFMEQYEYLIFKIRSVSPECQFIFITNNDSFRLTGRRRYSVNKNALLARDVFYRLAKKYNSAVFDMFAFMGGLNSMKLWESRGLSQRDKVHFTSKGYKYEGDVLYNAFIKSYLDYLKQKK